MSKKPVVIYGASGYTGRLVAEYLREYEIPFVAAGRDRKKIEEVLSSVPGIETAEYDIVEVTHDVDSLAEAFSGARVVCNTVGPFIKYGETVVEAALKAGVHYLDTTGEQSFVKDAKEKYDAGFREAGLALVPSTAYMYANAEIAAQLLLEREGIDTVEVATVGAGVPTYGSTQSIFGMFISENLYLEDGKLLPWPPAKGYEVHVPGYMATQLALPWGGATLPIWLQDDPRVRNARQLVAFTNRPMFEQIIELHKYYEAELKELPVEEQIAALSGIADQMQPGTPPRENRLKHRALDYAVGRGGSKVSTCTLRSGPGYLQTGALQAAAAHKLLVAGPDKTGFASPSQAFGHRYLLGALENLFPTEVEIS